MRELLLFKLDGQRYGVWKDQVTSVEGVGAVHHLPFLKSDLTVLAVIGDHTRTLADLSLCLGHGRDRNAGRAWAFLMSEQGQLNGFLVNAELSSCQAEPDAAIPVPGYLQAPFAAGFLTLDGAPTPLIDVRALFRQLLTERKPPGSWLLSGGRKPDQPPLSQTFWLAEAGGILLAIQAEEVSTPQPSGHRTARFPMLPAHLDGVAVDDSQLIPVVDLARRVARRLSAESPLLLRARLGEAMIGLLVDELQGTWSPADTQVKELPPICRTPWLHSVAVHEGRLVALLDLAGLLAERPAAQPDAETEPGAQGTEFSSLFGKQDVQLVELVVRGRRYAIPKAETVDVVEWVPTHRIPSSAGIVAGVGVQDDELLPVLDLARIQKSDPASSAGARMALVVNGDFKALVPAEEVLEAGTLPVARQKAVPVALPYPVVYGCYTDGEAVRLILNMRELALHFDESQAAELLPPLESVDEAPRPQPEPAPAVEPSAEGEPAATVTSPLEARPAPPAEPLPEDMPAAMVTPPPEVEPAVTVTPPLETGPSAATAPPSPPVPAATVESAPSLEPEPTLMPDLAVQPAPLGEHEQSPPVIPEEPLPFEEPESREQPAHRGWRMLAGFAASIALIVGSVAGLYFSGLAKDPTEQLAAPRADAQPAATVPAQPAAPQTAPAAVAVQPAAAVSPPKASEPPLYIVKEGDTLWDISQRLTGDPLNYRFIAGQNRIENPDLIFPGQELRTPPDSKPAR